MKVVGVMHYGGPEALQVVEIPDPVVGPGQVRIRVHAAAVSPTDTLLREGLTAGSQAGDGPPYVPGMDVAGVVAELGPGAATEVNVGDEVMAMVVPKGRYGAYSEQIVVPAESVVRIPAGASIAEASTLPMNGLTAQLAIDVLDLSPGQAIAVTGAAGVVGGYAVQLAKEAGLIVVADASDADSEQVRGFGADVVLPRGDDFPARVRDVYPDGVDGVVDGALFDMRAAPAVRDGGMVVTVRGFSGAGERGVVFRPIGVPVYAKETAKLDRLRRLVEEGKLTLRLIGTVPKEKAAEAHRRLEAGGQRGRMAIEF